MISRPAPISWLPAPADLSAHLGQSSLGSEITLWWLDVDGVIGTEGSQPYRSLLISSEQDRADRFKFPRLSQRFTITRGILRQLLGRGLNLKPLEVPLIYGDRGKPLVDSARCPLAPHFNLSHSDRYVLYGFSPQPLGVDVEIWNPDREVQAIARRFFSPQEQRILKALPPHQQPLGFLRHWVSKEAIVKATGTGLGGQLSQIEINFEPEFVSNQPHLRLWEITPSLKTIAAVAQSFPK